MLDDAELDAIEARANAATEGPWEAEIGEGIEVNAGTARTVWNETGDVGTPAKSWRSTDRILEVSDAEYDLPDEDYEILAANAEFIAHAREDVPALLADLRVARQQSAALPVQDADLREKVLRYADDRRAHGSRATVGSWRIASDLYQMLGMKWPDADAVLHPAQDEGAAE